MCADTRDPKLTDFAMRVKRNAGENMRREQHAKRDIVNTARKFIGSAAKGRVAIATIVAAAAAMPSKDKGRLRCSRVDTPLAARSVIELRSPYTWRGSCSEPSVTRFGSTCSGIACRARTFQKGPIATHVARAHSRQSAGKTPNDN